MQLQDAGQPGSSKLLLRAQEHRLDEKKSVTAPEAPLRQRIGSINNAGRAKGWCSGPQR